MGKTKYNNIKTVNNINTTTKATTITAKEVSEPQTTIAKVNPNNITINPVVFKTAIGYKTLNDYAKEPTHGSDAAAGYDLYAAIDEDILIPAHQTKKIGTGISIELPDNTFGAIFARSGLATKEGLRPANCVGVVDSDYRGEVIVALHNDTPSTKIVKAGDRIAQLVVIPYMPLEFVKLNELTDTARGEGGFGSTGK